MTAKWLEHFVMTDAFWTSVTTTLAVIGTVFPIVAYYLNVRAKRVNDGRTTFAEVRRTVINHQADLQKLAFETANPQWTPDRQPPVFLLTRPGWILDEPIPVSKVALSYAPKPPHDTWQETRQLASSILPRLANGLRAASYSEALVELGGRKELFNGFSYRLLDADVDQGRAGLTFGEGHYFDYLDTGEVLAYEAAKAWMNGKDNLNSLPIRRKLGSPFNLDRRATSCGVVTLTVRNSADRAGFYLHRRNQKAGEVAPGMYHTVPAGEFAPSDITASAIKDDLSLWRNIVREYAEEMLGVADARGKSGRTVDFENDQPYCEFFRAAAEGEIQCHFLGLGFDPLTWKPEILTVCVFSEQAFDRILRPGLLDAPVPSADDDQNEGTILMGHNAEGIPFTEDQINNYLQNSMRDAGRACLSLAWHHRHRLQISVTDRSR
jgi:hypothetical protein